MRTKTLVKVIAPLVAFIFVATACGLGGSSGTATTRPTPDTTPITSRVVTATTTATTIPTTTSTIPELTPEPEAPPSSDREFNYILTAKPRDPRSDGRIPKLVVPVYQTPTRDSPAVELNEENGGQPTDPNYWDERLTLLVINDDAQVGDEWAEVLLSNLPNGLTGWVQTKDFEWSSTNFRIVIDLSDRTVTLWEGDEVKSHTLSIIGRQSRPTPVVETYVEAKVRNVGRSLYGEAYGNWILPLAAFSDTLPTFQGGLPQVAIHGTNVPHRIGEDISSGCVRLHDTVIAEIQKLIPAGTPVSIVA